MEIQLIVKKAVILCFCLISALSCVSSRSAPSLQKPPQSLRYYYDQLRIKDFTEMRKIVLFYLRTAKGEIKSSKYSAMSPFLLIQEALEIAFSRPDTDDVLFRLKQMISHHAGSFESFDFFLRRLSSSAVEGIKNQNFNPRERATYYFILQNIVHHLSLKKSNENKKNLQIISKAQISVPASLETYLYVSALESNVKSPSLKALKLLKQQY